MNEYPAKLNTGYYRVRTDWNDDASQLGAYKLLAKEADGSYAEDAGNQGREPETGHRPVLLAG